MAVPGAATADPVAAAAAMPPQVMSPETPWTSETYPPETTTVQALVTFMRQWVVLGLSALPRRLPKYSLKHP